MINCVNDILKPEELEQVRAELAKATFADGTATAGWHAREVKKNLQLTAGTKGHELPANIVRAAILRDSTFLAAVRPRYVMPILFNRHEVGMNYGAHVDDPIMQSGSPVPSHIRTDVSFTLFLSDPASYQGGELVVNWGGIDYAYKMPAGSLMSYPSSTLHRVNPVTEGVRLAAVSWVQSEIREPDQRAVLFDLDRARRAIFAKDGKSETFDLVTKSHANLVRMWAEL
jgi:PKHD-type hydroxylase